MNPSYRKNKDVKPIKREKFDKKITIDSEEVITIDSDDEEDVNAKK